MVLARVACLGRLCDCVTVSGIVCSWAGELDLAMKVSLSGDGQL